VQTAIEDVVASRHAWQKMSSKDKAKALHECLQILTDNLSHIATEAVARKGSHGAGLGEEMCAFSRLLSVSGNGWCHSEGGSSQSILDS
jgi:acyl-CoA reductase-like NAD-dependent aldehyde dehydrogenase